MLGIIFNMSAGLVQTCSANGARLSPSDKWKKLSNSISSLTGHGCKATRPLSSSTSRAVTARLVRRICLRISENMGKDSGQITTPVRTSSRNRSSKLEWTLLWGTPISASRRKTQYLTSRYSRVSLATRAARSGDEGDPRQSRRHHFGKSCTPVARCSCRGTFEARDHVVDRDDQVPRNPSRAAAPGSSHQEACVAPVSPAPSHSVLPPPEKNTLD